MGHSQRSTGRSRLTFCAHASLIEEEQRSKAAAWAYFASEEDQAIRILLQSPSKSYSSIVYPISR
jgi:hypothetical protein